MLVLPLSLSFPAVRVCASRFPTQTRAFPVLGRQQNVVRFKIPVVAARDTYGELVPLKAI